MDERNFVFFGRCRDSKVASNQTNSDTYLTSVAQLGGGGPEAGVSTSGRTNSGDTTVQREGSRVGGGAHEWGGGGMQFS